MTDHTAGAGRTARDAGRHDRPLPRRAALARVGVLAAGVGALAHAVPGSASSEWHASGAHVNVRDLGARGDGNADDTAALQAAIDLVRTDGGVVFVPPGTYLTRRLTLYSRVHLRGSGGDSAVLKLARGANSAILESDGFDKLTGTESDHGITLFSVRDLALDGNKAGNDKLGYGLRVYGYGYELTEVLVYDCRTDGIYSEWGPTPALEQPSHQMISRLSGVRSHTNEGHGINFKGPHDSMFVNCLTFRNKGAGFRMAGYAHGSSMVNCHGWGAEQNISFDLAALQISCVNCYADIDGGIGVRISRNDCRWVGGTMLGNNHRGPNREIGVLFAPGPKPGEPAGCVVDTKIMNFATAAVDFGADQGLSVVRASLSQPRDERPQNGLGWIGTPAPTTVVEITQGLGALDRNLVIRPSFDLRAQTTPARPEAGAVRIFARESGGRTELCALFANGAVRVLAAE